MKAEQHQKLNEDLDYFNGTNINKENVAVIARSINDPVLCQGSIFYPEAARWPTVEQCRHIEAPTYSIPALQIRDYRNPTPAKAGGENQLSRKASSPGVSVRHGKLDEHGAVYAD